MIFSNEDHCKDFNLQESDNFYRKCEISMKISSI